MINSQICIRTYVMVTFFCYFVVVILVGTTYVRVVHTAENVACLWKGNSPTHRPSGRRERETAGLNREGIGMASAWPGEERAARYE